MRSSGPLSARKRQECDSEGSNEACRSQPGRQRERGDREGKYEIEDLFRNSKAQQQGLKRQPLADEAVEWRHRGDRQRTDQEERPGLRHALQKSAHLFYVARTRCVQDRPGAQKQQAFENSVVQAVIERGHQRQRCKRAKVVTAEY